MNVKNCVRKSPAVTGKWMVLIVVIAAVLSLPLFGQQNVQQTGKDAPASASGSPGQPASAAETACGSPGGVWFPDLRRDESFIDMDIMVKF